MLTQQRVRRVAASPSLVASELRIRTPCVAVHTEESQVQRFVARARTLDVGAGRAASVQAVAPPLIYVQVLQQDETDATPVDADANSALRLAAERAFGGGRIAAHRVYQLDACCTDPQWIPHTQAFRDARSETPLFCVRVVAFPRAAVQDDRAAGCKRRRDAPDGVHA